MTARSPFPRSDGARVPACHIDHITVIASSLQAGAAWVRRCLDVDPQAGGAHPRMGTHNLLLPLGATMFLEVIAVDPAVSPPSRPRWFELDRVPPDAAPRLGCWVARTDDIHASLDAATEDLGVAEPLSRGALEWRISIPGDGSLPMGGAAPALIQWSTDVHPARGMRDSGCTLVALRLVHPEPRRLTDLLCSLKLAEWGTTLSVHVGAVPALMATVDTPSGRRKIGGPVS